MKTGFIDSNVIVYANDRREVEKQNRALELLQAMMTETDQISFWDANIVAAAESAECNLIVSEDLNPGQLYAGMEVVDPFTSKVRVGNREI